MKVSDLVWHVDDISDGVVEPGIVIEAHAADSIGVYFFDSRTFETHEEHELTTRSPDETR